MSRGGRPRLTVRSGRRTNPRIGAPVSGTDVFDPPEGPTPNPSAAVLYMRSRFPESASGGGIPPGTLEFVLVSIGHSGGCACRPICDLPKPDMHTSGASFPALRLPSTPPQPGLPHPHPLSDLAHPRVAPPPWLPARVGTTGPTVGPCACSKSPVPPPSGTRSYSSVSLRPTPHSSPSPRRPPQTRPANPG